MTFNYLTASYSTMLFAICSVAILLAGLPQTHARKDGKGWELDDLVRRISGELDAPIAIAHRGYGANLGEIPNHPIENTLESIRAGFDAGASIIEIDVQVTKDGKAVVYHDDYLPDFTCINTLTWEQLVAIHPEIPRLNQALATSKSYTVREGPVPSGLVDVEIKTPSPLCDPQDVMEESLVRAVLNDIHQVKMEKQVYLESYSPKILDICKDLAPDIPVALAMGFIQFFPADVVAAQTNLPVELINKDAGFNLQWANVGVVIRLPSYYYEGANDDQLYMNFLRVALEVGADFISLENSFLAFIETQAENAAANAVSVANSLGFITAAYTVTMDNNALGWAFLESTGVHMIFIDDVPFGVESQSTLE